MSDFNINGEYFRHVVGTAQHSYSDDELSCAKSTFIKLRESRVDGSYPVMLFGKIQSGKTKSFTAAIALCLDNDYEIVVLLTKASKALAKQTQSRMEMTFKPFVESDDLDVYDIMTMPDKLTRWELKKDYYCR